MSFIFSKTNVTKPRKTLNVEKALRYFCTQYRFPSPDDEYTKTPQYPPILDLSPKCVQRRTEESWYKKIERQKTIEEKLFEVNVPRYWGWKCIMLKEIAIPYNSLNFAQYVTRTHILNDQDVPESYKVNKELSIKLANDIKSYVEDELNVQLSVNRSNLPDVSELEKENIQSKYIINALNRVLLREVCDKRPHLLESAVDINPRLEAFWSIGGIEPPDSVKNRRKEQNEDINDEELKEPVDRWVQYLGTPVLQIRNERPLPSIWEEDVRGDVPVWKLDPEVIGFENEYRHVTCIPGFWPGDQRDFGVLSYHLSNHIRYRPPSYGADEAHEALLVQGILASFGWLIPIAAYHGFSPFSEITYPFVTQTVLTDGKQFTVMLYQMNTNMLYSEFATKNSKTNLCWCSPTESLYDRIENGKIIGLNEEVLARLVLLYLTEPQNCEGVNLRPFLGTDVSKVADYEDEEKRIWLERQFKHFSANRPRHRVDKMYELYEWERIYKVEHQTRPIEPKRRPFELKQHPYRRKMSDHPGEYIPRALRPDKDIPKWRQQKFKKTFYPV